MNIFLEFKDKNIENSFYSNLDSYTAHMMITHTILAISALPIIPINQYFLSHGNIQKRTLQLYGWASFAVVTLLLGILARKLRTRLEKHKKIARWILDLFYTGLTGLLFVLLWDAMQQKTYMDSQYFLGWVHCLICISTLDIISRWYLKVAAYTSLILSLAIRAYLNSGHQAFLSGMFQISVFLILNTYFQERNNKKRFIEKYKLHVQTLILKEILNQTTEGIIICDLKGAVQFQNSSHGKFSWWDENRTFTQNLQQIRVEQQINLLEQSTTTLGLNIMSGIDEPVNFASLLEKLTHAITPISLNFPDQSDHQMMQNLMVINGKIANSITNNLHQMLEIRVMWLIYQEVPSLALIFTDITERSLIIKLQDTNDYKNRLLASVSHELRTPLNASLNFIQAAIEEPLIPAHIREDFLTPSLNSNQLLLHLINDILDFSQMSANKLRLTYEACDVKKTLNDCANLMKLHASKKGLELSLEMEVETQNSEFTTDHNRLKQIVINLLSNAVKFTLKGMIKVKAVLSDTMEYGKILQVDVIDTGIGISDEDKDKLFKSLERIDLGERAFLNSTGVGLGLVISSNLVRMLGPNEKNNGIQITSQVNKGTTFSFWITNKELSQKSPCKLDVSYKSENFDNQMDERVPEREIRETQRLDTQINLLTDRPPSTSHHLIPSVIFPSANSQLSSRTPQRCLCPSFLIVDDDVFNITALSMILKQLGYTCNTAYNGQQAIDKVVERQNVKCGSYCRQYKTIFMDFSMPIMDGFEATRRLKNLMKTCELPIIPIIGCTAFVQETELKRGIEAGMNACCTKPLNKNKISAILSKFND